MAKPVIYYDEISPPARSCLMLIKLLDIDVEYQKIELFKGDQFRPDFVELNPAHTVPVLKHNELVLTDSHAILMHLCDSFAKNDNKTLFPEKYEERMVVINQLLFNCSFFFRRDSDLMSGVIMKGVADMDMKHQETQINEAYSIMEKFLTKTHKYMAGPNLTIADISLVATLSAVDLIFPVEEGRETKWPNLYKWFQIMKLRPEYRINQEGLEMLKACSNKVGKFNFSTWRTESITK